MLFTDTNFFLLLLLTLFLYFLPISGRSQVFILIVSSLIFYASSQPYLLILLLISCFLNVLCSYFLIQETNKGKRLIISFTAVIANLAILSIFKYKGLLFLNLNHLSDDNFIKLLFDLPLPIGISFYTFQGISLIIDTLRENQKRSSSSIKPRILHHFTDTFFYLIFFPQLIAGPIVKSKDFLPQIKKKYFSQVKWQEVFDALLLGYFLKKVIADNLHNITYSLKYPEFINIPGLNLIALVYAYSIQIFSDFAGYSLIAIGLGRIFCYELPVNFNSPYLSSSFSEFWTRWHMTLSSWLKEYLYIPLGGNRKGNMRCYLNLVIVMALGGLWHGAGWNYAIWGLYHGTLLCVERYFSGIIPCKGKSFFFLSLRIFVIFALVSIGWLFFIFNDISNVSSVFSATFNNLFLRPDLSKILAIMLYSFPVIVIHMFHFQFDIAKKTKPIYQAFLIFGIFLNAGTLKPFIYFQF